MRYALPIVRGTLLERYKRFLADVRLDSGRIVTAHCSNPGAMHTCSGIGRPVLLSDHGAGGTRQLRYTWEAIRMGRTWVVVNTQRANHVMAEAIAAGVIRELHGYAELRREVRYGRRSRVDIVLSGHRTSADCYVEVKSATMRHGDGALFPDAVTERGTRHLEELGRMAVRGRRAVLLFFVARADCSWVAPADDVDPLYGRTLRRVARRGVELYAYQGRATAHGVRVGGRLEVRL